MGTKTNRSMRFDSDVWKLAEQAARQTRRSTTEYIEYAVEQQIRRDTEAGQVTLSQK